MDDGGTDMLKGVFWAPVRMRQASKGVFWAPVQLRQASKGVYRALGQLRQISKGVYWAPAQLRQKGRPPVRQWQGATTAGGVPKEGLPEAASERLSLISL